MRTALLASLPESHESGSEALRALPALVALRAFDAARDVLRGHVEYLDEGLAPERFDPDDGSPVYGDPTPSLWLIHAADLYARRSADGTLLNEVLFPALEGVMQFFRSGTRGVRVDADGLLATGEGRAAIKRADLNALWYHALVAMAQLARLIGRKEGGAFYLAWAREHQKHFNETFWDEEHGCLFESLGVAGAMHGVSPGQLLAVSLPPSLLTPERALRLVGTVEKALFTPYGLRERPTDTRVWTAWLGPFISAYLRVHDRDAAAQARVREWLEAVEQAAATGIAGHVPEWFELEPGAGSPAQRRVAAGPNASMLASAELLRVWVEEVDHGMSTAPEPAPVAEKRSRVRSAG
jgi:glycogen debranching enzyme